MPYNFWKWSQHCLSCSQTKLSYCHSHHSHKYSWNSMIGWMCGCKGFRQSFGKHEGPSVHISNVIMQIKQCICQKDIECHHCHNPTIKKLKPSSLGSWSGREIIASVEDQKKTTDWPKWPPSCEWSTKIVHSEHKGRKVLQNFGIIPYHCTVSWPRRPQIEDCQECL